MNQTVTREIFEVLKPYIDIDRVTISQNDKDWTGRNCNSDYVLLDDVHKIGFEVFDDEIIVFYFSDHTHFEDYTSELEEGEDDYVKRAKDFLLQMFTQPIRKLEKYKNSEMISDSYSFVNEDGSEDFIGGTTWKLMARISPFNKIISCITEYCYNLSSMQFEVVGLSEGIAV